MNHEIYRYIVAAPLAALAAVIVCNAEPKKEIKPHVEPAHVVQEAKAATLHELMDEIKAQSGITPPALMEEDTEALELLAMVIYQEAGGDACSDETRIMVGNVVMNRVASDLYPDTIEEVLSQKGQYGRLYWTGLVWPERASQEVEAHAVERAYQCARRVLDGEKLLPEDVIWQAEFEQGSEVVAHQDGLYFCR